MHVVYGFPSLKIHAKMTLVIRREGGALRRYVHLGTGNYHALTARVYEDFGLFTADEEIAADVADLFNHITGFGRPQRFRKLLVAPLGLRERLIEEIRAVGTAAEAGKTARIRIESQRTHGRGDRPRALPGVPGRAPRSTWSQGASARSGPGVEGLSENIRVRSILGRFLEHSRVFSFQAGKKSSYFIGSADLMPRNLDHRLEILAPVEDSAVQQRLSAAFDVLLADNTQAWELLADGTWHRLRPKKDEPARGSQDVFMRKTGRRSPRRVPARRLRIEGLC